MKTNRFTLAVVAATLVAVVTALAFLEADALIGYGTVAALLAMVGLEYRINWRALVRK